MVIDVPEICGDDLISRASGLKIRECILTHWDQDVIEIRLHGKLVGSVSFFDEAIGLLMKREKKSLAEIKQKLKFPDILKEDRVLLNHTVMTRVREQEIAAK